jgi:hypothetical protein
LYKQQNGPNLATVLRKKSHESGHGAFFGKVFGSLFPVVNSERWKRIEEVCYSMLASLRGHRGALGRVQQDLLLTFLEAAKQSKLKSRRDGRTNDKFRREN